MFGESLKLTVRVKPGARRSRIGGKYVGRRGTALVVAVAAPAVAGRANEAVLAAIAKAFGTKKHQVSLVSGARMRDKVVQVTAPEGHDPSFLTERLEQLLGDSDTA